MMTAKIVPGVVDTALRIVINPIFQPNNGFYSNKKSTGGIFQEVIIYGSKVDNKELDKLLKSFIPEREDYDDSENDIWSEL